MTLMNPRILTSSTPHTLRALSLLSFFPSFIFLLPAGISSGRVNPAICLLPLFFSSLYSAVLLANERSCSACDAAGLTGTPLHTMGDVLFGAPLLVCLVLGWVMMGQWSYNTGAVILGSYGTVGVVFNSAVHLYFVIKEILDAFKPGGRYPSACPQCQHIPFPQISVKFRGDGSGKDGYKPLLDGEGRPAAAVNAEDDAV